MRCNIINAWSGERKTCWVNWDEQAIDGYWLDDGSELTDGELLMVTEAYR